MTEMMRGPRMAFPSLTSGVKVLLLINVAVFLANAILGGELTDWFAVSVTGLLDGYGLGVLRLLSHQFAHSYTDVGHILMNMLVLYFFGTMVESEIGRRGIVKLYLASAFVGALVQLPLMAAMGMSDVRCLGASGACYGIMVYAAVMAPNSRVWFFGLFPVQLRVLVGILVFIGIYYTILELRGHVVDNTAHGAHLGGALFGFLAARHWRRWFMTSDHRPFFGSLGAGLRRWNARRRARARAEREADVDVLLDKVKREGMSSLTPAERRALERASRDMNRR